LVFVVVVVSDIRVFPWKEPKRTTAADCRWNVWHRRRLLRTFRLSQWLQNTTTTTDTTTINTTTTTTARRYQTLKGLKWLAQLLTEDQSQSYGAPPDVWDHIHTVLPTPHLSPN